MMSPILKVLSAIDPIWMACVLLAIQGTIAFICWWKTLRHLGRQRKAIAAQSPVSSRGKPDARTQLTAHAPPELMDAWKRLRPANDYDEVVEPAEALSPDRLLPLAYNARLDVAAPGLFTGLGIFGTFVGLILAFSRIDPARSESSIQPLISGMQIAFWNSLAGVGLALAWTLLSRTRRQAFDVVCRELARTVERNFGRRSAGDQVLLALSALQSTMKTGLEAVQERLGALQVATANSSNELLEKLAPALERSFHALIDMPFDRLEGAVSAYGSAVNIAAAKQAEVVGGLVAATSLLSETKVELAEAVSATSAHVKEFEAALDRWKDQAEISTALVTQSKEAAESLTGAANSIRSVSTLHGQLASALGGAVTELRAAGGSISGAATQFDGSANRLEVAAGKIEALSVDAAEETARAARGEMQLAIQEMSAALQRFGREAAESYETSASRVVSAVDTRMSDLTDRLSAELTTLSARLPESMEQLSDSARQIRTQVKGAVNALEAAVRQLDAGTKQSLAAQLSEYDKALAEAVDRFSGTLSLWDGKVTELASASTEMKAAMEARKAQAVDGMQALTLPAAPAKVTS